MGVGLRSPHYEDVLREPNEVDWIEIISETFLYSRGRHLAVLDQVAERYPVTMHGVSLSIGSTDPLNFDYLRQLKNLAEPSFCSLDGRSCLLDGSGESK